MHRKVLPLRASLISSRLREPPPKLADPWMTWLGQGGAKAKALCCELLRDPTSRRVHHERKCSSFCLRRTLPEKLAGLVSLPDALNPTVFWEISAQCAGTYTTHSVMPKVWGYGGGMGRTKTAPWYLAYNCWYLLAQILSLCPRGRPPKSTPGIPGAFFPSSSDLVPLLLPRHREKL